jgi:anti-anti-sigma factor
MPGIPNMHCGSKSADFGKISKVFMIPKVVGERLSTSMKFIDIFRQSWEPEPAKRMAGCGIQPKELQLKLSLEVRNRGDVVIVYCQGRIVYRDEAVALSSMVSELLQNRSSVVLDLSDVYTIDSAGMGELVLLHTLAESKDARLKCANPSPFVRNLLDLTQLDSFLDIHPSLGDALDAFQPSEVCADC